MMRSLWTAASGMTAQQTNVDTISNNLANVNTAGYKKERLEFKSLLYQTMARANVNEQGQGQPVNLQVGLGVRPIATARIYTMGNLERTDHPMDFAIEGDGFFVIDRGNGETAYTRDGSFKLSVNEDGSFTFVTSEGFRVLNTDGEPITLEGDVNLDRLSIAHNGQMFYTNNETGETDDLGMQIDMVQFPNRQGLEAVGGNLFYQTVASGAPVQESSGEVAKPSRLQQGVLEMANVQLAEEMVKLIVAQRAYEINSKAITTSDDMLQQAIQLKK